MKKLACLLLFLFVFLFCNCNSKDDNNHLPIAEIECGTAKISGKFRGFNDLRKDEEVHDIYVFMTYPLTGRVEKMKVGIKEDETFSLEIPIETSSALGHMQFAHHYFIFPLISGKETVFDLYFKNEELQIEGMDGPDFLLGDTGPWHDTFGKALSAEPLSFSAWGHYNLDTLKRFMAEPKEYIPFALKYDLENRLEILRKDKKIPKKALDKFDYEVRLMRIPQFIHFGGDIWDMYKMFYRVDNKIYRIDDKITEDKLKNELDSATYIPPHPDISYWVFLKEFDLNNPKYLYTEKFFYIIQMLLENETLSIPPIEENPIDKWLTQTKNILADLVGFNEGLFYDILICNTYSKQFVDKQKPLSNKQIENIKNYYKGGEVEKILLRENERIVMLDKKRHQTVINKTPDVEKGQLANAVISKYQGKVVVIDYWATWCAPCMDAMSRMAEMKTNFINKDVVFVYITTESSPKNRWEEVIPGIGGEHYYLTQDEWEYLLDEFNFNSIPTYQIYDAKGKLQEQFTGFQGAEDMQKKIEKLLSE